MGLGASQQQFFKTNCFQKKNVATLFINDMGKSLTKELKKQKQMKGTSTSSIVVVKIHAHFFVQG